MGVGAGIVTAIIAFVIFFLFFYYIFYISVWSAVILAIILGLIVMNVLICGRDLVRTQMDLSFIAYCFLMVLGILIIFAYVIVSAVCDVRTGCWGSG